MISSISIRLSRCVFKPSQSSVVYPSQYSLQQRKNSCHHLIKNKLIINRWTTSSSKVNDATTSPTYSQLKIVALRAAIPMVGFGFIDNMTMITAGEAIDASLGVSLGLSTMAAAGLGQCVSDVAGYTGGGIVSATVAKLSLPQHNLSLEQLSSKRARMFDIVGGSVGVVTGCLMGMTCLLFMDTEKVEREKRAKELNSIFESIVKEGHRVLGCEQATLWLVEGDQLWSKVATGTTETFKISKTDGIVGACLESGQTIRTNDAYNDQRFNSNFDKLTGIKTKTILACPVKDSKGNVIGVVQMLNKIDGDFTDCDDRVLSMLASHVGAFIRIVSK